MAALREEAVTLDAPLIRFQGRTEPAGGAEAIRRVWKQAAKGKVARGTQSGDDGWAYTAFGTPGTVTSDTRDPLLGIRTVRFANGVMLNLKQTALEQGRVRMSLAIDGGDMLNSRQAPQEIGRAHV